MHRLTIAGILAAFVMAGFGSSSGVFQVGPDTYQFYNTEADRLRRHRRGTRLCHPRGGGFLCRPESANTDPGCRERPASQQCAVPLRRTQPVVLKVDARPAARVRTSRSRPLKTRSRP